MYPRTRQRSAQKQKRKTYLLVSQKQNSSRSAMRYNF